MRADRLIPLEDKSRSYDALIERIGDARVVLLGEATHGSHEFYDERARITQRLLEERGFSAVLCEADWPDAYRINRYVKGISEDSSAEEALGDFKRFPTWMWSNEVVRDFIAWLRAFNERREPDKKVGFYGLDLYSLNRSAEAVIEYLDKVDPPAAARARDRYGCFEYLSQDGQAYGYAATLGSIDPCEDDVIAQLIELQQSVATYRSRDGRLEPDEHFHGLQNARLVKNAERYYRTMYRGGTSSWNLRDTHMADTLEEFIEFLERSSAPAKVVVWAHNSHIGDARATRVGSRGELNLGQLARERFGDDAFLIGFTTYTGSVTAASEWDGPAEKKNVRPALPESYEAFFHEQERGRFLLLDLDELGLPKEQLEPPSA
ncbi:MAG: erythromycin esterase family protein [Actinomycetota bacterium]